MIVSGELLSHYQPAGAMLIAKGFEKVMHVWDQGNLAGCLGSYNS